MVEGFDTNDVVAVMCNSGEYVGKYAAIQKTAQTVTIEDPRMVVSNEQMLSLLIYSIQVFVLSLKLTMTCVKHILKTRVDLSSNET